ncbi:hypothetical protein ACIBP4_00100 [Micromonospora maritima]|uniref:Uncharacterized protein n=1 Tax=Micromonospora maritima TaxID=986711 RepID=A0ABW7ZCW3_9ACTN
MVPSDEPNAWSRVFTAASKLAAGINALTGSRAADEAAAVARLRTALRHFATRREALVLVGSLPTEYTITLADDLAWAADSEDTLLVRQAFGRLPRSQMEGIVPAAVWRQLADSPDAEAYRRFAELLDHLGLDHALRELCETALASVDEGIREVGEDFLNPGSAARQARPPSPWESHPAANRPER